MGGQRGSGMQQPPPRVPSIPALISAIEDMLDTVVALDDEEGGLGPFEDPSWPSSAEVRYDHSNMVSLLNAIHIVPSKKVTPLSSQPEGLSPKH